MNAEAQRHAACCELVHDVASTAGEVRIRVTGASMLPAIWPGDVLTVRPCDLADLNPGQIILFRRDGKLTAHRIHNLTTTEVITRGDSLAHFDPPVQASEIVGRVSSISRDGQSIHPHQTRLQQISASLFRHSDFCLRLTVYLHRRLHRIRFTAPRLARVRPFSPKSPVPHS